MEKTKGSYNSIASGVFHKFLYLAMLSVVLATTPSCKDDRSIPEIKAWRLKDAETTAREIDQEIANIVQDYNDHLGQKRVADSVVQVLRADILK